MFKLVLVSIVIVPALLGLQAAKGKSARRGLSVLLALLPIYGVFYLLMLYYLRRRWVG